MSAIRIPATILAGALAVLIAACSDSPVFGDTSINGTTWRVVEVRGESLGATEVTLALDAPSMGVATVETPCRTAEVPFAFDTDSEGVSFGDPGTATGPCSPTDLAADGDTAAALADGHTWHLLDASTIEIRNIDGVSLLKMTSLLR